MSLRFQFLQKELVQQKDEVIVIEHAAADALLDTSQGYLFGKLLQQALTKWKNGAELALNDFIKDIGDLDMKDFAYLLRFRLREEGQPLSEYLEWLFGERLKGLIGDKVDWKHASFSELDGNETIEEKIEGAFEGPSVKIAEFFHHARVNKPRACTHHRDQLGDLYVQPKGRDIRAVITPDCDLVVRKGGAKVKTVLTMGGRLNTFDEAGSAADDFVVRGRKPYSVRWNPKDLETFPITGHDSLHETDKLQFFGTLRPLYAQEMQRRALTDLSRVGLPVAPALGINATATVWRRTKNANDPFIPIKITSSPLVTIILSRAGQKDGHRVLLRRRFFNELIDRLNEIDPDDMEKTDAKLLDKILRETDKLYEGFLRAGGLTKGKGTFGFGFVLANKPDTKQTAPWLQIAVKVSEKAMEDCRTIDPLVASLHESADR